MLLSKQALNAALFTSTDARRDNLQHIRIDPDGTVWASCGHTAVRLKRAAESFSDADFPIVDGIPPDAKEPEAAVYLHRDVALDVVKRIPKRSSLPILSHVLLKVTESAIYLAVTDLKRPQVTKLAHPEIQFPSIETIFADAFANRERELSGTPQPFGMDTRYLKRVADYRKGFDGPPYVRATSCGAAPPVSFEWSDYEGNEVLVLVMPARV